MKKALLVGINKYKIPGANLNGCRNDVIRMKNVLIDVFSFPEESIHMLLDYDARKEAILSELSWLTECNEGDWLVFHFSGHGSQVPDTSGDEIDKLDEVLCPSDMDWNGNYISDDDLGRIFSTLKGKKVQANVILDCCFSGTGTRTLDALVSLPVQRRWFPRFLPPPVDLLLSVNYDTPIRKLLSRSSRPIHKSKKLVSSFPTQLPYAVFSACQENQTSADAYLNGDFFGAFTFFFTEELRQGSKLPRLDLMKRVTKDLIMNEFEQRPFLDCKRGLRMTPFFNE